MKTRLRKRIEQFLKSADRFDSPALGSKKKKHHAISPDLIRELQQSMMEERAFSRKLAVVYVVLICIYFAVGIYLVLHYAHAPNTVIAVLVAKLVAVTLTLGKLHKVWESKSFSDMVLTLAVGLPPEETVRVIETIYWGKLRKDK